jgi:hypothetical protein
MEKTTVPRRVSPERTTSRNVPRSIKRIVEDAKLAPEIFLRFWRAGRGGE